MAIPTNGLVFYAPLAEDKATAETGQTLTKTGTITQAKIDGIPCSYFNGSSYIRVDLSTMPYGTDDFAFSLWARCDGESGIVLQLGSWTTGARLSQLNDGLLQAWLRGTVDLRTTEAYDRMVHVAFTRNSGTSSLYINGSLVATSQESADLSQYTQISLMNSYTNGPRYITGYLAAVRLYNRGLSADEITELANEFSGIDDGTGVVIDGLFLSNSRPKAGDKGLLVNDKFFIPFAESSEGGSGDTSAFESDAMAIIGTPTGGGGESGDEIVTLVSESGSQGQSKVAINATGSVIVTNGSASQTYTEFPAEFTLSAGTTTIQGTVTTLNCTTSTLTSIDISLCPTLTSLDCKGNALSALDISNNANLVTLACNNNGLTMLNIAQNTALKYLAAYSNKFTSDVVNNILAALVSNAKTDGTLDINYQEISAPPTGQGLADKQTLIDRGWTVTTD